MTDTSAIATALRAIASAIERLAYAIETNDAPATTANTSELMTIKRAAEYVGFRSASAIRKAVLDKKLTPAGKRGGRGSLTFSRPELDRFMRGDKIPPVVDHVSHSQTASREVPKRRDGSTTTKKKKHSPAIEDALRRLDEIGKPRRQK